MNTDRDVAGPSLVWVRSSYSNGAGGECVECAAEGGRVFMRDTKVGNALVTSVGADAWLVFTRAIRRDRT
ncbi:DUF397 domain-containing protein [Streptomyces olivaceus]|uniref:DUF397 domain-containing protein n=1 Tax=Streptomyces olivaceus TaxID=47716 RepID=UPI0018854E47|nr:DUF397 domain-containing protein [Streptomyces olivaceus]